MKFWVGITDEEWFKFLAAWKPDEINFWRPGGQQSSWHPIPEGAPFLFKLHSPNNFIVGGGYFVKHTILPLSLAWLAYGEKNGAGSLGQLREAIQRYRGNSPEHDPSIGCTLLSEPFFWPEEEWIPIPFDWPKSIVQGKTFDSEDQAQGTNLWSKVEPLLWKKPMVVGGEERYGTPRLVQPRLGQGAFRILVTEAYHRRCSITGEKTLPVLEAAHIKPYSQEGPHAVNNGLLLRSDLHILFDQGYLAIDQDLKVKVSPKIREMYENGRDYYAHQGQKLLVLPEKLADQPSRDYLEWNLKRFLA
jgi:HNH endonuclease